MADSCFKSTTGLQCAQGLAHGDARRHTRLNALIASTAHTCGIQQGAADLAAGISVAIMGGRSMVTT